MSEAHTLTGLGLRAAADRYLRSADFVQMLFIGIVLHIVVLATIMLWPSEEVTEIPVRTLNITLGGPELQAVMAPPAPVITEETPPIPEPEPMVQQKIEDAETSFKAKPKPAPKVVPKPVKKARAKPAEKRIPIAQNRRAPTQQSIPANVPAKVRRPVAPKPVAKVKPVPMPTSQANLPKYYPPKEGASQAKAAPVERIASASLPPPTVPKPMQYVRSAEPAGEPTGNLTAKQIRARYEQKMSAWLQRHRVVPPMARQLGQHGKPVLRVRIDRTGAAKYFAIERSSGYQLIDNAALDMVRRATPFPAPPSNYPGGQALEFLIPVTFDLK